VSDRPDAPSSGDGTPETPEVAEVRRLLAEARHTEPIPDEVAARMSRAIDRLGEETPAARPELPSGNLLTIPSHRRRRAGALLAAAAAIVVGGVVFQNVDLSSGSDSAGETAADSRAQTLNGAEAPESPPTNAPSGAIGNQKAAKPVKIHPRSFVNDAERARQDLGKSAYRAMNDTAKAACTDVPQSARAVPARYKRADAALVFRRPQGGSQIVELFVCGQSTPIRTTTLSVP
jgi:hypothetical protein